jgi:methyl coenzyme M reductase subunit D
LENPKTGDRVKIKTLPHGPTLKITIDDRIDELDLKDLFEILERKIEAEERFSVLVHYTHSESFPSAFRLRVGQFLFQHQQVTDKVVRGVAIVSDLDGDLSQMPSTFLPDFPYMSTDSLYQAHQWLDELKESDG